MDAVIAELKAQKRNTVYGYDGAAKNYFETGAWTLEGLKDKEGKDIYVAYDDPEKSETAPKAPNVTASSFTLPLPSEDVVFNKHLMEEAQDVEDVRATYVYNF
jgi:hypothetical protein